MRDARQARRASTTWSRSDFGDGTAPVIRTGTTATLLYGHSHAAPGTYTATVTTTDLFGRTSTASTTYPVGWLEEEHGPVTEDEHTVALDELNSLDAEHEQRRANRAGRGA
jgi:PKD domain